MCPRYVPTQSKRLQLISETSVRAIEENECSLWSTGPLKSHPGIRHTQLSCMRPGKGQSVVFLRLCREFPLNLLLASASLYHDNLQIQVKKNIAPSYDWPDLFRAAAMQAWLCACKQNTRCFDYAVKLGLQLSCRFSFFIHTNGVWRTLKTCLLVLKVHKSHTKTSQIASSAHYDECWSQDSEQV